MLKLFLPTAFLLAIAATPASAQMAVDIPIWSNGILGQQALRNTYDNTDREMGIKKGGSRAAAAKCSADALPAADRKRMEAEYMRRHRADGKASADAWVQEQGRRFRMKLIADGVCESPSGRSTRTAEATQPKRKKPLLDKQGKPCSRTRVENRVSPGFGGEAMSMGLVVVCAN